MMPKRTTIKILLDTAISKVLANPVWKGYRMGQVGKVALRDVRNLDARDVRSHDAASQSFQLMDDKYGKLDSSPWLDGYKFNSV